MKTNWKYWIPICFVAFWGLIVISYRYAKPRYKPDNISDLLNDFSWLINWPKWLDFPLMQPINSGFDWLIMEYGLFFEGINYFLLGLYTTMKNSVVALPWPLVVILVIVMTYFVSGKKMSTTILIGFCTFFIGFLSPRYWDKAIMTTCIVFIGIFFCLVIGIPIGIAMARKPKLRKMILPVLDLMQTIPSFCYLIPGIILFGLVAVPAIISIFVYAAPPLIRLTDLGIRLVDKEIVEAADAFGASKKQKLWGVDRKSVV